MTGTQRFGRVIDPAGSEESGGYLVRDEESGSTFWFGDADIVTEGFRAARAGERNRSRSAGSSSLCHPTGSARDRGILQVI